MKKYQIIRVFGRVQGVWFRKYTKLKADELAIRGWVRNEADGHVLIAASGDVDAIDEFISWCHHGSPESEVTNVQVVECDQFNDDGFEIHYF